MKAETRTEKKEQKGKVHVTEFQEGSLFRSIPFHEAIDPSRAKAEIKNGLLTIVAPIAESAKARRVDIHAA